MVPPIIPYGLRSKALEAAQGSMTERLGELPEPLIEAYRAYMTAVDGQGFAIRQYWSEVWAPKAMNNVYARLMNDTLKSNGKLRLWRSLTLDGDPLAAIEQHLDGEGWIGVHWSYNRGSAHPHFGDASSSDTFLLEGIVQKDDIDWVETLAAAANPRWVGEDEVRLRDDAEVLLVSMTKGRGRFHMLADETAIDISRLAGSSFRAGRYAEPTNGM